MSATFAHHRIGYYDHLRPAESSTWQRSPSFTQRLGRFVGERLRRLADSTIGEFAVSAFNYLRPSTAPKAVAPEPFNHNPRGVRPVWADTLSLEPSLTLTDADLQWLARQAGSVTVTPTRTVNNDPLAGLYTDTEITQIDKAFAATQGPCFPGLTATASNNPR